MHRKFLATCETKINGCADLAVIGLLISSILFVVDVNGIAYAQPLGPTDNADVNLIQQSQQLDRILIGDSNARAASHPLALAFLYQPITDSSKMTGVSSVALSTAQCVIVPGAEMTFHEICPSRNNATNPGTVVQVPSQNLKGGSLHPSISAPNSTLTVAPTAPNVNSHIQSGTIPQSSVPVAPPLIPSMTMKSTTLNNNTLAAPLLRTKTGPSFPSTSSPLSIKAFKTYNNILYGVSIHYPSNWRVEEGDNFLFGSAVTNVATFLPPSAKNGSNNYHMYVAVSIVLSNRTTLNSYLNHVTELYAHLSNFSKTGSTTNSVLSGNPAYILEYSYLKSGSPIKAVEVGTLIGDKVYFVSYVTDPQTYTSYLPTAYFMIRSLGVNVGITPSDSK